MRSRASALQTAYIAQMENRRRARLRPLGASATQLLAPASTTGLISATPLSPFIEVGELLAAALGRVPRE